MQRPAAFVQCIRCRPLCIALYLSLLLSALPFPSLFPLLLPQAASRWRSLVCCCCLSKQKLSTICLGTCVFYFALHLTTAHAARSRRRCCSASALYCWFYNCLSPQLPPLPPPLPHLLLLLQFFIFHFIFRSFNFYLCK